jgi:tRNA pseudouridine38-40 synthase
MSLNTEPDEPSDRSADVAARVAGGRRHGILLQVAYDGFNYSGMALQSNAPTVERAVQLAVHQMDPNASRVRICSRTDSGVHAVCQYVAFSTDAEIALRGWLLGLTSHLPRDIAILQALRVAPGFLPSRAARSKLYRYQVLLGTLRDPFLQGRAWRVSERLNHRAMVDEAETLLGTHDFAAFRSAHDHRATTVRTIEQARVGLSAENPRLLQIEVRGNRFLHNMVRIIAGTLVDVGRGKREPGAVSRAIQSGNRLDLGMTAPAEGLYLQHIDLDVVASDKWPDHSASQITNPLVE